MPENWIKPKYVYGETTTFGSLIEQFANENGNRTADIATALESKEQTVLDWIQGKPAASAFTKFAKAIWRVTGIDLDRILVIEAKRRIWERDPAARAHVTLEKFQTRDDIFEELNRIKKLPPYSDGTQQIAWQIKVASGTLNGWTNAGDKPSGDNLDRVILGLSRGVIETGTATDLAFRTSMQMVCGREPKECLGVNTFEELRDAIFNGRCRNMDAHAIAKHLRLAPGTISTIREWNVATTKKTAYETLFALARALAVERGWTTEQLERFDHAAKQFAGAKKKIDVVRNPVFGPDEKTPARTTEPQFEPRAVERQTEPELGPTIIPPAENREPRRNADDQVLQLLDVHVRGIQTLEERFPEIVRGYVPPPKTEVRDALLNIRWRLDGMNDKSGTDWIPTDEEVQGIIESVLQLYRIIVVILGIRIEKRAKVLSKIAPSLVKVFVLFKYKDFRDLSNVGRFIDMEEDTLGAFQNNKQ